MNSESVQKDKCDEYNTRLGKRLTYILRYGALKEGIDVNDNGYAKLDDLLMINMMKDYTREEVFDHIKNSVSYRNVKRYEWMEKDGIAYVRASYLRNFEKSPHHFGTKVFTLMESAMQYVINHIDDYDLQDFPDEVLIRLMMRRLKRQKKLNSSALLVPTVTWLDLQDVYLTNNTLRVLWSNCPNLVAMSLKNCGYIITDSTLAKLAKNLPQLQRLNLCGCDHLTPNCLSILSKRLKDLQFLNIASGPKLTYESVMNFIQTAKSIKFLDAFYLKTSPEQHGTLTELAAERGLELHVREPYRKLDKECKNNEDESDRDLVSDNQADASGSDSDEEAPMWDMFERFDNDADRR